MADNIPDNKSIEAELLAEQLPAPVVRHQPEILVPNQELTAKQTLFVHYYTCGESSTNAYLRAYELEDKYLASIEAAKTLKIPAVQAEIERRKTVLARASQVQAEWIVRRLVREATNKSNQGSVRVRALELLAKINGILTRKVEVSGPGGGEIPVKFITGITGDDI